MLGEAKLKDFTFEKNLKGYAIKEPVFSFDKFPGVNKELRPRNEKHRRSHSFHKRPA
jgi:carbamoyl-phosphate synthase large subunit